MRNKLSTLLFFITYSLFYTQSYLSDTLKKSVTIDEVKLKTPSVKFKKGKIILSPAKDPVAASQNSWEFIKNSGYVETTELGSIKIKQKPTTVYINDRRIPLSGQELKTYLEAIPSNMIANVEVIGSPDATNPSNEMSIIKITLCNSDFQGFKVGIGSSIGFTKRMNMAENANINWKGKKLEVQTFISSIYKENIINSSYVTEYKDNIWTIPQSLNSFNQSNRYSTLLAFTPNSKHKLTLYSEIAPSRSKNILNANNGVPTDERLAKQDSIYRYNSTSHNHGPITSLQVNYTLKNDSATSILKVQLEYLNSSQKYRNDYQGFFFANDTYRDTGSYLDQSSRSLNQYVGNINYIFVTKKWGDWSVGSRFSYNKMNNPIEIFKNEISTTRSNLDYKERYYSFFLEGSRQFNKTYLRIGIRQESNFMDFIGGNSFDLKGWYPNILIQQSISNSLQLEASYKKSLIRPDYYLLNSLKRKDDENSVISTLGNQNLKPQINHDFDVSLYYKEQMLSFGFQYSPNYISTIILRRGQGLSGVYNNFKMGTFYATLSLNKSFKDKYFLRNYFTINYLSINEFDGVEKQKKSALVNNRTVGTIALKNNYTIQASYFFNTNFYDGFFKHGGYNSLDFIIQKKLPKLNLIVYIMATDILKGMSSTDKALYNVTYINSSYSDDRAVKIGLYWNFGNQKLKFTEKDDSLTEDTKKRNKK